MMLMQIASWKDPANWSRNLHRLIQRFGVVECGGFQCSMPLPLSEQDYPGAVASPFPVQLAANGLCQDWWGLVDEWFHGRSG